MNELKFRGNPQLETERLLLRRLTMQDDRDVFEYASDEEVPRYVTWDTHRTIDDSRGYINFVLGRYERDEAGDWGIVLKDTGKLVGSVGFAWCDMKNMRAEIGLA